jgi:hypothetical protein
MHHRVMPACHAWMCSEAQQARPWGAAISTDRACAVGLLPSTASSPQLPLRLKPPLLPPPLLLLELRRCCCRCSCCCCCCFGSLVFCWAAALPADFAAAPLLPPLRPFPCCFAAAAVPAVPAVPAAAAGPEFALSCVELLTWLSASLAWPSLVSSPAAAAAAAAAVEAALGDGEVRPRLWWRRLRLCGVSTLPLAALGVDEAIEPGVATSSACRPAAGVVWIGGGTPAGLLGVATAGVAAAAAGDPAATASGDLGAQCWVAGDGCGCSLLPCVLVSLLRRPPDAGGVPWW